jgi:hypothetical protein
MSNYSFPKLSSFLAAYFCPYWQEGYDWEGEEPSFEAVARHYKAENATHIVEQTTKELEELLKLPFSDSELEKNTESFFDYYQADDLPLRQILENLLKVLKEPNNGKVLGRTA